ncbi:MAG: hypothetical protein R2688_05005 [Fimbriimonadaceae bacterium]
MLPISKSLRFWTRVAVAWESLDNATMGFLGVASMVAIAAVAFVAFAFQTDKEAFGPVVNAIFK